ncbi:MAG: hypothetical protein HKL96_09140 [Phycisphaerales bacterium]|nr:hypothetical protein [Phycisphaerales bacterium]
MKWSSCIISRVSLRWRVATVLLAAAVGQWAAAVAPAAAASAYVDVSHCSAHFIVDACRDRGGNVWLATEDHGIFRFNPRPGTDQTAQHWQQFTASDGLADATAQSVACDSKGRVWVGSLCHGVTVYNGQSWQHYGLLTDASKDELAGPIGEHIFSIRVCPLDGSVWLCTNSGIARYEPGYKTASGKTLVGQWQYYTVAEGLPSDDVQTVAFGPHGRVYVATRCDGIAIARPVEKDRTALRHRKLLGPLHYQAWRIVKSRFDNQVPLTPTGSGLPSDLLNDILVTPTGTAWVATDAGVAWSSDGGSRWRFVRGKDWLAKDKGLMHPPSRLFVLNAARRVTRTRILSEDYCTCLAQDSQGDIWVGHRQAGIDIINPGKNAIIPLKLAAASPDGQPWQQPHKYVDKILMLPKSPPIICCYGGGAFEVPMWLAGTANAMRVSGLPAAASKPVKMPTAAGVPTKAQVAAEEAKVNALAKKLWPNKNGPHVIKLDDDWCTEGNWLGRYGTYWCCLCAMKSPGNFYWGAGWRGNGVDIGGAVGPHVRQETKLLAKGDSLRYWIQWLYTSDPRVLEMPKPYLDKCWLTGLVASKNGDRREAEWDDHGEGYAMTWQGPGLYISVHVPPGVFLLALYNVNKDGHTGPNRFRDYTVDVRQAPGGAANMESLPLAQFNSWPELARKRIVNFWSGVYTRFMVHGPITLCIKLGRNYSRNTIVSAIMLGLYNQRPPPYGSPIPDAALFSYWYQKSAPKPAGAFTKNGRYYLPLGYGIKQPLSVPPRKMEADAYLGPTTQAERLRLLEAAIGGISNAAKDNGVWMSASRLLWRLHRFRRSEAIQESQGYTTPRQIERSLRWWMIGDPSASGGAYVHMYLKSHPAVSTRVPAN